MIEDKIILVTGSTDGIGKQTALELAEMGTAVMIHGRSFKRCKNAADEIKKSTGNNKIEYYVADFSSLEQVRSLVEEIRKNHKCLDVLINNAGVIVPRRELTEDGFEMTFQVNHLAAFLLTFLLLDLLKAGTKSRIVNVSSMAHSDYIDFSNLQGEKKYDSFDAYELSKLCNICFTYKLAEILHDSGITVNCLHPGVIATKLLQAAFPGSGRPVSEGSKTSVYLASAPEVENATGKYFVNKHNTKTSSISYDKKIREKLWKICEELTGIRWDISF